MSKEKNERREENGEEFASTKQNICVSKKKIFF